MRTRTSPPLAAVFLFTMVFAAHGQPQSIITLDPPKNGHPPLHRGDEIVVQCDATITFPSSNHLVILDESKWPWILVQDGAEECWLNFTHVVSLRIAPPAK